jgi:hypothetical protein
MKKTAELPAPKAKAKAGAKSPPLGAVSLNISIDVTEDTPTYYANHLEVGHSHFEFMLNVSRLPPKPSAEQMRRVEEQGALIVNPEMQILFSPKLAVAFMEALRLQIASYETNVGKI